jgi:hypothetical protein
MTVLALAGVALLGACDLPPTVMGKAVSAVPLGSASSTPAPTTGSARCDGIVGDIVRMAGEQGATLTCDPSFDTPQHQRGWYDGTSKLYVWPRYGMSDPEIRKVSAHELGHLIWDRRGRTATWWRWVRDIPTSVADQPVEEDYADTFSFCGYRQDGVSYMFNGTAGRPDFRDCDLINK